MNTHIATRRGFWVTTQIFGMVFFLVMGILGMLVEANDAGCMYVTPAFFMVLAIVYPLARLQRFGAATAVFALYATAGSYIEYQMQWVVERQLASPWGALAWGLLGLLVGLAADVTYLVLRRAAVSEGWRVAITGAITGAALFVTTYLAMTTLYASPASQQSHFAFFSQRALFSLPWMVLNGGFAGYCASALADAARGRAQARAIAAA
jgi:hypothetical protein